MKGVYTARILKDKYLHQELTSATCFINGTTKNSFEIPYTALVLCCDEDELNLYKRRERQDD